MAMTAAPEFNNFVGEYVGSVKEADFTFIPRIGHRRQQSAAYPSVVLESGWHESSTRLLADSKLWQEGSAGAVRVVLQVKFYEPDNQNEMRLVLSISRTVPGGGPTQHDHYASPIFPAPPQRQDNPSISLDEFYAGACPPKIDPATAIPLDLELLREEAGFYIRKQGHIPADMA
ncbi:hypothetical protein B9Z19DRAFT_1126485 [Tuber borchii]|uniref:Uncharacterized protein n=1 Tax=Tuber borchii TaxID=42251 RepID=A0A2T6ZT24_TUBBO|nr:hypothetical protein B9Z19DRAFT_1126485 [Tuber borchii]